MRKSNWGWRLSESMWSVGGITVLCHFRKYDLMPIIICKNDKHHVTLYNIFKYDRRPFTFELYSTEMKCIGKTLYLSKLINNCYFFKDIRPRWIFWQNGIVITWNNHQKGKLVKQLITQYTVIPLTDSRCHLDRW